MEEKYILTDAIKESLHIMEDFSDEQFYVLDKSYIRNGLLNHYHNHAATAIHAHRQFGAVMSDHAKWVACILIKEIPLLLEADKCGHEYQYPYPEYVPSLKGYVYLIRADNGLFKIGKTGNPKNRLKSLNTGSPCELRYVSIIKTDNMDDLEERLHYHFSNKRIRGEWFALTDEDVDRISQLVELLRRNDAPTKTDAD